MKKTFHIFSLFIAVFSSCLISAQDGGLNTLVTFHRNLLNPAFQSKHKVEIGLGSILFNFGSENISFDDMFTKSGEGVYYFDGDKTLEKLDDQNNVDANAYLGLIDLHMNFGKFSLCTGYGLRTNARLTYTDDLVALMVNGNAPYIGQTLDVGTKFSVQTFNQIYVGGSYDIGRIQLGAKLKFVGGVQHISTNRSDVSLLTDEEIYQLHLTTDIEIVSSGALLYNGIDDVSLDLDPYYSFGNFFQNNQGLLFDVGVSGDISDKWRAYGSILDIGSISWNTKAYKYVSKKEQSFVGIDLADYLTDGSVDDISLKDTLYNLLDLERTPQSFTTKAGIDFHVGTDYDITERLNLGALYSNYGSSDLRTKAISIQSRYRLGKAFDIGLNYTIRDKTYSNFGITTQLHLGPFNAFLATDSLPLSFKFTKARSISLRTGISLAF